MGTQPNAPAPGVVSVANAYQAAFNAAYYASKAPAMQGLYAGRAGAAQANQLSPTQDQLWALAGQLIVEGYTVDEEIYCEGMDPYTTMFMRELYGQDWEPAGLGNTQVSNINQPGAVVTPGMYQGPVPAGQIKVSTLLADYPPYPVPASGTVAPPVAQATNPVGIRIIPQVPAQPNYVGDVFRCGVANDGYAIGAAWSGISGAFTGTWTKEALEMGIMIVWVKTA